MAAEAAILLKDIQGEKNVGRIAGLLKSGSKAVYRGELLLTLPRVKVVPRKDGKNAHNYQLASDPSVTLFCTEDDVAPVSDYEYHLMEAIKSREDRFDVFRKDILDWGSKLKEGTFVYVTLPSKTPLSNQRAVSVIKYAGPLPNERGIQFGVEIQEEKYRNHGSSNGFFGGEQFFTCDENCALFVSLDRLLPMEPIKQDPQPELPPVADPQRHHQMITRSQDKAQQSNLDQHDRRRSYSPKQPHSHFRLNDRVVAHDKHGTGIHGSVKWIEEVVYGGDKLLAIGIETDISVQSKEFVGSLHGLGQHFKCLDSRHGKLVMPEYMVISEKADAAQRQQQSSNQGSSVDAHAHEDAHAQFRDGQKTIQRVTEQCEDEYLKGALNTSIDREKQVRVMREIEKAHKEKQQNTSQNRPYVDPHNPQDRYDVIPGATDLTNRPPYQNPPPYHPPGTNEQLVQPSTGASSARGRVHVYDSPNGIRRDLQKMRDQRSIQDEYLLGHHSGGGGGSNIQLRHQRSMPGAGTGAADEHHKLCQVPNNAHQPRILQDDPSNQPLYNNIPGTGGGPQQELQQRALEQLSERRHSDDRAYMYYQDKQPIHQQGVAAEVAQDFQPKSQCMQQQQQGAQQQQQQATEGAQQLQQQLLQQYEATPTQPPYSGGNTHLPYGASAVAPQETTLHSFSMGSTVQLQSNPPRYGVIQWMGTLPGILEGRIAGVDLEEPMEGCSDGSWNGVRYFNCQMGHGFFCPISSLTPDQRFAQTATVHDNPLDYVAHEEHHDQFVNPGQIVGYIGDGKGIQGHQNSCYLDSTVFGLFAASDVFDSMFLEQGQGDLAGDDVKYLLWKGIVNPLRKNGTVRYESVMRLRNKLEELGKMKGVNQDEKDPEEFLNMLFKHTLHVPPFINIKRPFGVEQEYFVQLFVEHDESLKLPTVGNLLEVMFKEQKIRFTKVPSKLLIQIPRYGREFKTYQKTIPGIKLGLKGLLSSKHHCFICGDSAWMECSECKSNFVAEETVVYFCEKCAQLSHGKPTNRDKHVVTDVVADAGGVNELDLLSVICIETSHYICFTRSEERWVFFDSMANRVDDMYNIPKVVDCTDVLNEWVYPANGDLTRLLNTPPRELPEYVRRFTQDIYLCVYIQPDFAMYGDFDDADAV